MSGTRDPLSLLRKILDCGYVVLWPVDKGGHLVLDGSVHDLTPEERELIESLLPPRPYE